uniref:Homeobox domain-containing protein n=1 Tax=Timema monikensis TaxID=170555 RepID=A0A7R9HSH7_9NEOP|nr:unnamed protein product [Timema monikensis]
MEGQDICAHKARPVKPLAITSMFNTLFPLNEVDIKRVIVSRSVKNIFTPHVQLEKFGGNCAVFNRTEWQELDSYKSVISKLFSNTQPPQKDLINVAVDRRDMWLTPVACYCNDLIDTLIEDVCDKLTKSTDAIDLEQPMVESHIKNLDLISITYYTHQVVDGTTVHHKPSKRKKEPAAPTPKVSPAGPGVGGDLSDGGGGSDSDRKRKKARTTFTGRQIFELEKQFEVKKYLSSSERAEMAKLLNVTETQVSESAGYVGQWVVRVTVNFPEEKLKTGHPQY